ncbi:hypothetical protein C6P46_006100 [Rhodotorula mucilaginosa]|uniref:Macrofage activating glycoprotein n=1 Tax=Rhodotorula mucilaginosa TaxID=5537 RepID=A0A9P7B4Q8_RHOMI|nr:hypothetical protein C6P46_006100 [Rhodotorula mucilaginosa]TKA54300.1 hypothetical protein B0A53_03392 [Rhodotorula sp. CCFEE 5036]
MLAFASLAIASSALVAAQSTITAAPAPSQIAKAKRQASASPSPLTAYSFAYSDVPYQVNPYPVGRGPQSGYNLCNSTTVGPNSQCQTAITNNISDFCLWGSPTPDGSIGDIEAAVVAYCTTDKHGTRVIPPGAITGLQVMHTSEYIQWTGHIDMTALGLQANDTGGELDPHGADLLGNPLGGLVFSTALPGGDNSTLQQVIEWNNFVGSGVFCWKSCFDSSQVGACQNRFDLLGCAYNMPAAYEDGVFLDCDGEVQDIVGTYTGADGKTSTWSQPESLPATSTLPWTPRIPASSNCKTYQSTDIFAAATSSAASSSATKSASGSSAAATGSAASASRSGGSAAAANASASSSSSKSNTSGASTLTTSAAGGLLVGALAGLLAVFA